MLVEISPLILHTAKLQLQIIETNKKDKFHDWYIFFKDEVT
jgi:hypothetical protein